MHKTMKSEQNIKIYYLFGRILDYLYLCSTI